MKFNPKHRAIKVALASAKDARSDLSEQTRFGALRTFGEKLSDAVGEFGDRPRFKKGKYHEKQEDYLIALFNLKVLSKDEYDDFDIVREIGNKGAHGDDIYATSRTRTLNAFERLADSVERIVNPASPPTPPPPPPRPDEQNENEDTERKWLAEEERKRKEQRERRESEERAELLEVERRKQRIRYTTWALAGLGALLFITAILIWPKGVPPPAQDETQATPSVVAPEPSAPEIPKVIIEHAWAAEALDADGNGIGIASSFPVNHRYGSDLREGLAFGISYAGLTPGSTQIKIELWKPDARFASGRCIPYDRSLRESTNGSGYALSQVAGTFSCSFEGYMLGPGMYEARVFADDAVVHISNFTISERQEHAPFIGNKDSPPTAEQKYWNDINRNQGNYKDSPQKSGNKNAASDQHAGNAKILCILPDASEKMTDAETCRNVLGGVPYR